MLSVECIHFEYKKMNSINFCKVSSNVTHLVTELDKPHHLTNNNNHVYWTNEVKKIK